MNNPLLPNPRRVNWLGKEPEPDLSWFEEELKKHLENTKRESQFLEGEMLKRRRLHAEATILEFMLQLEGLKEFIDKDLLKELKEAPVMLMGFTEDDTPGYEQRCKEDPLWGPMQEASAFGKGHDVREFADDSALSPELHNLPFIGIDPGFDPENETFSEYLDRMWSNETD